MAGSSMSPAHRLDLSLESRSRSSTWPHDEDTVRGNSESPIPSAINTNSTVGIKQESKKMRNAWGNMSYADLITQAILSSPEKRLTLSEIYDWIVQNVPYFSDKASSPSTAGWKVSINK